MKLRVIDSGASTFPCTSCGACCAYVTGPPQEKWRAMGWLRSNGSCIHYDPVTKNCAIYEDRPVDCRVDEKRPENRTVEEWHKFMTSCCDAAHESVYGVPRERDRDCDHEVVGQLEIQLETTSTCNAACHFCPYPVLGRAGGIMAMGLFTRIVDEATTVKAIHRYVLHGLGEPLLDPHLEDRVWYIRQAESRPVTIEIYTNGVYLTPEKFEKLKDAGVNSLMISLNAVRPEQHEQIMGIKGKFERVVANCDYAIAHQDNMAIQVHAVSNGDQFTEEDAFEFYARWGYRTHNGHGICIRENNWAGDNRTTHENWKSNEACGRALEQIYVMYDGRVTTCCLDPTGKQVFGDLNKQTLREVYNSEKYLRFREAHAKDEADRYDICRYCTRT